MSSTSGDKTDDGTWNGAAPRFQPSAREEGAGEDGYSQSFKDWYIEADEAKVKGNAKSRKILLTKRKEELKQAKNSRSMSTKIRKENSSALSIITTSSSHDTTITDSSSVTKTKRKTNSIQKGEALLPRSTRSTRSVLRITSEKSSTSTAIKTQPGIDVPADDETVQRSATPDMLSSSSSKTTGNENVFDSEEFPDIEPGQVVPGDTAFPKECNGTEGIATTDAKQESVPTNTGGHSSSSVKQSTKRSNVAKKRKARNDVDDFASGNMTRRLSDATM